MAKTAAIGEQDFSKIIEKNYFYVDKTNFIKDWWENGDMVTFITRPRRFGKTLTLNMLYYFFSAEHAGRSDLFENLDIWKEEKYRKLQGTYPVIFLSFANVKADHYAAAREGMIQELADVYDQNVFLLDSDKLTDRDKEVFQKVNEDMSDMTAARALKRLSDFLYKHYGRRVIILLDEYDTPMQEAYVNGYWDQLAEFMRKLMNATFKTNLSLERGMMTGITRVGKESVFSDFNNPAVVTTTTRLYEDVFGFTENEVFCALEEFGLQDEKDEVKRWYDGYRFGGHDGIYNPWSVINFLKFKEFRAYWANTSSNKLVGNLIKKSSAAVKVVMEDLLNGGEFWTKIDEQIVFHQLDQNENAVWSLLLASGYLKITGHEKKDAEFGLEDMSYALAIVNLEILLLLKRLIQGWFEACSTDYNDFIKALLSNDVESMTIYMNQVTLAVISSFDSGSQPSKRTEPERFYHGLVLGLMMELRERYTVTSNRESGRGRYDVLLEPRNAADDAVILEFKVQESGKEKALCDTVKAAVQQILDKRYAAALEAKGVPKDRIRIYGFAFRGKEVLIDGGYIEEYTCHSEGLFSTDEKYYMADHGIREAVFGGNMRDIHLVLENIVFMELMRRGYQVTEGKSGAREVDFIAAKRDWKLYVQVCYLLASEETVKREFGVYDSIPDNFPKYVVSLDEFDMSRNGIRHWNIRDFLLAADWD